jgi:hypothetical protein
MKNILIIGKASLLTQGGPGHTMETNLEGRLRPHVVGARR